MMNRLYASMALLFMMALMAPAQNAALSWQNSQAIDTPISVGNMTTVDVDGLPFMNYALIASKIRGNWYSDIGLIEVELSDPDFTIGIDGFDPSHHLFSWGFFDANGDYSFSFVPWGIYDQTGETIFMQIVANDPTTGPFNITLSNPVGAISVPRAPVVTSVIPRSVAPGSTITVAGNYFNGHPLSNDAPIVTIGGETALVTSWNDDAITAIIPTTSHSGNIVVSTTIGSSPNIIYDARFHVVVTGAVTTELLSMQNPIDGHFSVIGSLQTGTEEDIYSIHLDAGEELFVEVFNFDLVNLVLAPFDPSNWASVQLNPELELSMPNVPLNPVIYDNDGGPSFAAAIGIAYGKRFVAPFDGDFSLKIGAAFNFSTGNYLLNTWTKQNSVTAEPSIIGIHPNVVVPGADIEIYCWGVDFGNLALETVEFSGPSDTWIPVTPTLNAQGHMSATVPTNAVTGHLRICNSVGLLSSFDADHYESFYLRQSSYGLEAVSYQVSGSLQILGNLSITQEVDNYQLNVLVGDSVRVRGFAFDIMTGRILKGKFFENNPLDPEIRIADLLSGPVHTADVHSGPGTSAAIGGFQGSAWIAPRTDGFELSIRSWFLLSSGDYLLDVVVD